MFPIILKLGFILASIEARYPLTLSMSIYVPQVEAALTTSRRNESRKPVKVR
jgi:hypothetical protein